MKVYDQEFIKTGELQLMIQTVDTVDSSKSIDHTYTEEKEDDDE